MGLQLLPAETSPLSNQHHVCHRPPPHHRRQQGHRLSCQVHRRGRGHRRCCRIRGRDRFCVRLPHHRLRQEPLPQAATLLLRHPGIRPVRSHGTVLLDDGIPPPVRFLESGGGLLTWCCSVHVLDLQ